MLRHRKMDSSRLNKIALINAAAALVCMASPALAQVLVYPQRPSQSRVRHFAPEWRYMEVDVSAKKNVQKAAANDFSEKEGAGEQKRPGRFVYYFYESSRPVAERALPVVKDAYRSLISDFSYTPEEPFPFFLYNNYLEFMETNLFPVQIGVLGVTSPMELDMAVPYFGDHQLFSRVATHEMVHQFMVQKLRHIHKGNAFMAMEQIPLWFVEGMAEYYTWDGLDPETTMLIVDLINHPRPKERFFFESFFQLEPYNFFGVYKLGQARCAFLEQTYGKGVIQRILEKTTELQDTTFPKVVEAITGDNEEALTNKFSVWVKNLSYEKFLNAKHHETDFSMLSKLNGYLQGLTSSHDGHFLAFKAVNPHTGQLTINLVDHRHPDHAIKVEGDHKAGVESLHATSDQNFALSNEAVAYIALSQGRDVIYIHSYKVNTDGEFELGKAKPYRIGQHGLISADALSFSPDGQSIAFIGFDESGQKDLFAFDLDKPLKLRRLTTDAYAERGVAWGPQGIIYSSAATTSGNFNLFRVSADGTGEPERMTQDESDHFDPAVDQQGRVLFVKYIEDKANIVEASAGKLIQRSDSETGVFSVSPGHDGGLWGLYQKGGKKWPVHIAQDKLLSIPVRQVQLEGVSPAYTLEHLPLDKAAHYEAFAMKNWRMGPTFAVVGGGYQGVSGQILTSAYDLFRNHTVEMNLFLNGTLDWSEGYILYSNQQSRTIWGVGPFQSLGLKIKDTTDPTKRYSFVEKFTGVLGSVRYPFSRFFFTQADVSIGVAQHMLTPLVEDFLSDEPALGGSGTLLEEWHAEYDGANFQTQLGLSFGYNSLRYHAFTGPIAGSSVLVKAIADYQPQRTEQSARIRLDAEKFFPIGETTNIFARGGYGTFLGGDVTRSYYLSSIFTLRPVPLGDTDFLLGRKFFFTTLEWQFPLKFIPILEGVVALDFGGSGDSSHEMWSQRVFGYVTGLNLLIQPLVVRLHFAKPVGIGTDRTPNDGNWVTHFSLTWQYD